MLRRFPFYAWERSLGKLPAIERYQKAMDGENGRANASARGAQRYYATEK